MKILRRIDNDFDSVTVTPDQLGEKVGDCLTLTATSKARHTALVEAIDAISEREPGTKIIVFANAAFGGYNSALKGLKASGKKFCHLSNDNTVHEQNEIISWFRHVDATCCQSGGD